jgi:hypothetical protein
MMLFLPLRSCHYELFVGNRLYLFPAERCLCIACACLCVISRDEDVVDVSM